MNQIAKMSEVIPQPASESAAALSMIERIARDPSIDIARLQEMQAMYERIRVREAKDHFNTAMSAAQAEMTTISTDSGNPQTRSKYASLAAIDRALRPIYTKHGFSVTFDTDVGAAENIILVLAFVSCGGHERIYKLPMPADGKGARGNDVMTKTHATMSAITYARRGLLKMIFNIAEGDDDDGNAASHRNTQTESGSISEAQADELRVLLQDLGGANVKAFCQYYKIDLIEDLPAITFDRAKTALQNKKKAMAKT